MSKTLLLADGSVTIQRVVELTFAHEDVRVVSIADGRKAMQWLSSERPDIVLADVDLPDTDGYGIAAHVRKVKRLQHVPVLLLAGAFEPVDQDRVRNSGCDGVIIKPFEPQQLVARVRELLAEPEPVGVGARESASSSSAGSAAAVPAAPAGPTLRAVPPPPDLKRVAPEPKSDAAPVVAAADQGAPLTLEPLPLAPEKLELPSQPLWQGSGAFGSVSAPPPAPPPAPPRIEPLPVTPPPAAAAPPPAPKMSLANAFTALLAAEQSAMPQPPIAPMPQAAAPTVVISDSLVEDAVRKVLVRMTDDLVRRIVLETAERLIKEEIEKIKTLPEST
jgi:CheY-like chemotaxis protein